MRPKEDQTVAPMPFRADLLDALTGQPQDEPERRFGAVPMRAYHLRACASDEAAQHPADDQHIVELSCNRDEVGHEIERHRQVAEQCDKEHLVPSGDTSITEQAAYEQ